MLYLPIYVCLTLQIIPQFINCNWSKPTHADILTYLDCLNGNLDVIEMNDGYPYCNNHYCTDLIYT